MENRTAIGGGRMKNGTHAGFWKGETKLLKSTGVIIGALQVKHIGGQDAWVDE